MIDVTGDHYTIHFRDVRLWSNALCFNEQKKKIQSVIDAVQAHSLLDHDNLGQLLQSHPSANLLGFPKGVDVPNLAGLHKLIGENWIGERILEARSYQVMRAVNSQVAPGQPPILIIFPPIFHVQLTNAYQANRLSKYLKEIRESLLANLPQFIAFTFNKEGVHWLTSIVVTEDLLVYQGDSLDWAPDDKLPIKLKWFLSDVMEVQGRWREKALGVPLQGPSSGSCRVISMSVIHSFVEPVAAAWSIDQALDFRMTWLKEFLEHHIAAVRSPHNVSHRWLILKQIFDSIITASFLPNLSALGLTSFPPVLPTSCI